MSETEKIKIYSQENNSSQSSVISLTPSKQFFQEEENVAGSSKKGCCIFFIFFLLLIGSVYYFCFYKIKPSFYPIPQDEDLEFTEEEHRALSRKFATEGMVLAKNPEGILPLLKNDKVVLFGEGTDKTIFGGGGSGAVYQKGFKKYVVAVSLEKGIENKVKEGKCLYEKNIKGYLLGNSINKFNSSISNNSNNSNINNITSNSSLDENDIKNLSVKDEKKLESKIKIERSIAILTISRTSREGKDRNLTEDIQFTNKEIETYKLLQKYFDYIVIVLNVPSMIEINEIITNNNKTSILISFLPGVEAGNAIADVLFGDVNPSGHLTDTWAKSIYDYPTTSTFLENKEYVKYKEGIFVGYRYFEDNENNWNKVLFPFGYGLSYTNFEIQNTCNFDKKKKTFTVISNVKNIGKRNGKQVIQVYVEKPQNIKFIKAKRELVGFAKTKELSVGEEVQLKIEFKLENLASYDDIGVTGNKHCYVLDRGEYNIYVGTNVAETRDIKSKVFTYKLNKLIVVKKLTNKLVPNDNEVFDANTKPNFDEFMKFGNYSNIYSEEQKIIQTKKRNTNENENKDIKIDIKNERKIRKLEENINSEKIIKDIKIISKLKYQIKSLYTTNKLNYKTVLEKLYTMEDLVKTMSNEELAFLTYGHKSKAFVTGSLGGFFDQGLTSKYLIPFSETMDGPAGLRHVKNLTASVAWPCATLMASTFDVEILEKVGEETGKEARKIGTSIWLAPAMNIHRNPLCGRNFEYYSEDPLISGKMAAAVSRGVQKKRVAATLKHFCVNDKEDNRMGNKTKNLLPSDSRLAERVAREIYLKGFEIAVKEGNPWCIMTSYNKINGEHTSTSSDLLNGILRGEWGFDGIIMTDWDVSSDHLDEFKGGSSIKMPNNKKLNSSSIIYGIDNQIITRKELEKTCVYLLKTIAKTSAIDPLFNGNINQTIEMN